MSSHSPKFYGLERGDRNFSDDRLPLFSLAGSWQSGWGYYRDPEAHGEQQVAAEMGKMSWFGALAGRVDSRACSAFHSIITDK